MKRGGFAATPVRDSLKRRQEPEADYGKRKLLTSVALEVRQEVEVTRVVAAVQDTPEPHHCKGVILPSGQQRPGDDVGRVDRATDEVVVAEGASPGLHRLWFQRGLQHEQVCNWTTALERTRSDR